MRFKAGIPRCESAAVVDPQHADIIGDYITTISTFPQYPTAVDAQISGGIPKNIDQPVAGEEQKTPKKVDQAGMRGDGGIGEQVLEAALKKRKPGAVARLSGEPVGFKT